MQREQASVKWCDTKYENCIKDSVTLTKGLKEILFSHKIG